MPFICGSISHMIYSHNQAWQETTQSELTWELNYRHGACLHTRTQNNKQDKHMLRYQLQTGKDEFWVLYFCGYATGQVWWFAAPLLRLVGWSQAVWKKQLLCDWMSVSFVFVLTLYQPLFSLCVQDSGTCSPHWFGMILTTDDTPCCKLYLSRPNALPNSPKLHHFSSQVSDLSWEIDWPCSRLHDKCICL